MPVQPCEVAGIYGRKNRYRRWLVSELWQAVQAALDAFEALSCVLADSSGCSVRVIVSLGWLYLWECQSFT